jgi:hypothetical protein
MSKNRDNRVADLYKKLYELVRIEIPDDTIDDVSVALSALTSLASMIAVHNSITRESYLHNCAFMYDVIEPSEDDHELH